MSGLGGWMLLMCCGLLATWYERKVALTPQRLRSGR
jgi:hypothetical protein